MFHQTKPNLKRSDGSLWASGYDPLDRLFRGYVFYEMIPNPRKHWWCPWRSDWVSTGHVWKNTTLRGSGFEIIR